MSVLENVGSHKSRGSEDKVLNHNPYLNSRRTENDRVGHLVTSRRLFVILVLMSMLINLAAVGGIIHLGNKPQLIPFLFYTDQSGQLIPAGVASGTSSVPEQITSYAIGEYVKNSRMVSSDTILQEQAIVRLYAMMVSGDPAETKTTAYMRDYSPFERSASGAVEVQIESVLRQTPDTWEVTWMEKIHDTMGNVKEQYRMRGLLTVYRKSVKTMNQEVLVSNPFGLFVKDYNWSKVSDFTR